MLDNVSFVIIDCMFTMYACVCIVCLSPSWPKDQRIFHSVYTPYRGDDIIVVMR